MDLKNRGLKRANLFCTDGLTGFSNVVEELFENPRIQRCLVHVSRNIISNVRVKDRKEISDNFKKIYNQKDKVSAEVELNNFMAKWKKYPSLIDTLKNNPYLFTF